MTRHPPTLDQAILAEFITEGHFGHHIRRMRQIYAERIDVLKTAAEKYLDGVVDVAHTSAGTLSQICLFNSAKLRILVDIYSIICVVDFPGR